MWCQGLAHKAFGSPNNFGLLPLYSCQRLQFGAQKGTRAHTANRQQTALRLQQVPLLWLQRAAFGVLFQRKAITQLLQQAPLIRTQQRLQRLGYGFSLEQDAEGSRSEEHTSE